MSEATLVETKELKRVKPLVVYTEEEKEAYRRQKLQSQIDCGYLYVCETPEYVPHVEMKTPETIQPESTEPIPDEPKVHIYPF